MKNLIILACVVVLTGLSNISLAQVREPDVRPDTEIVAEQYLLLGNATRGGGESQVAVNPLNPNQIAVAGMSVMHNNEGKFEHTEFEFRRTERAVLTYFATSRDRGLTWSIAEDPMRDFFRRYRCLDPFAEFAADGTLIMGCEAHFPVTADPIEQIDAGLFGTREIFGGVDIILSTDGGLTWGKPIEVINSWMPKEILGPGAALATGSAPADAPKIIVDRSNGKIYIMGAITAAETKRGTQIIRTSKDRGRSWGMVYTYDSDDYPVSARGNHDAANGVLVVTYVASKVPDSLNQKCPCLIFGTSKDDGKTFDRHVVPTPPPVAGEQPSRFGGLVFANPSKQGNYIILRQSGLNIESYMTEDSGVTWTKPKNVAKSVGTSVSDLTARYNDRGEFAVSWRANFHDPKDPVVRGGPGGGGPTHVFQTSPDTSEIWSVLSRDGGKTFSSQLKVSTAPSPGLPRRRGSQMHSPDYNSINIDHDFVHFTWYDYRSGFMATWYGRVPLKDYK